MRVGLFLIVLAGGQFVNVVSGSVGYLLTMTGHERELRLNMLVGAITCLTLSLLLIPKYEILGGAIATSISIALQNLLGVFQVNRLLGFNTLAIWRRL
uniref:polysaccharide biosynthesis C-terminal domain-containing protein n=1 Tax=Tamilnaduibacter salinus TaxID=1484056 RepID=UPI003917263A